MLVAEMARFRLSKWYLDCVTDEGDASICYAGAAKWGLLPLWYSSLLETTGESVAVRQSIREYVQPRIQADSVHWASEVLKIAGDWKINGVPQGELQSTIFSSSEGFVEWRCLIPCGSAHVGGRSGLGYVERLTMTIAPWRIPIQTLSWGRFTSASHSVIWIDWAGEFSRRITYINGVEAAAVTVRNDLVEFADGSRLLMDRGLVIRQGMLGDTALKGVPGKAMPARILRVNECKWRSRARFRDESGASVEGWAIHERVDWPR